MYFPFLIKLQQKKLKARTTELLERKKRITSKPVTGATQAIKQANDACGCFKLQTKTKKQKLKSYLPGTKQFRLRLLCAERLSKLEKILDAVEVALENGKPRDPRLPYPFKVNGSRTLKKSQS